MLASRTRWLALAGPVFTVVFLLMIFVVEGDTPSEKASAQAVMDFYNSHQGASMVSVFTAPLGAALLVLFFSQLRTLARGRAVDPGAGPTVMVAGAVVWASALLLSDAVKLALVTASDHGQAQVAQTMNVLDNDDWIPFIAGIAVTLLGAGMTVLATGLLPRWLGWVALVAGVVSLAGPGGFLGFFVAPLWMLVAGVLVLTRQESAVAQDDVAAVRV